MNDASSPADRARHAALTRVEKAQKRVRLWIGCAAATEGVLLLAYVLLADFSNRTHVLILVAACLVYATLAYGMIALGAYVKQLSLTILRAIEELDPSRDDAA